MAYQINDLLRADGHSLFEASFTSLDATAAAAKVFVALSRIEYGNFSNLKWFQDIGEFKIDWGPSLRICIAKDGPTIILLWGGGSKKRQQRDINQALADWQDYKLRKSRSKPGK